MKTLPNNQRGALTATFFFSLLAILLLVFIPTATLNHSIWLAMIAIAPLFFWLKPRLLQLRLGEAVQSVQYGWFRLVGLQLGCYGLFSLVDHLFGPAAHPAIGLQWNAELAVWLLTAPIVIGLCYLNWGKKKTSNLGTLLTANYTANHPATILFNFISSNAFLTTLAAIVLLLLLSIQQSVHYTFFSMPPLVVLLLATLFIAVIFYTPFFKKKLHTNKPDTHKLLAVILLFMLIWTITFSDSLLHLHQIQSQTLANSLKIILGLGICVPIIYQATLLCKGVKVYQAMIGMLTLPVLLACFPHASRQWMDIALSLLLLYLCCSKRYFIATCYASLPNKNKSRTVFRSQQGMVLTLIFAFTLTAFNALGLFFIYVYLRTWLILPLLAWACIQCIRQLKE